MANIVEYILGLRSEQFNTGIALATEKVGALEGAFSSAKSMLGTLGVGFAIFKGAEFVHESVEAVHALEQSIAQVKAGLESTKGAAGLTFGDIEESAKSLSQALPYSRAVIMDMQAQILTFPGITKETFGTASQAILDMSSRLHRDTNSLALMVGKALQDPEKGVTRLTRVGVNFNDTQIAAIKKMVEVGDVAKAQKTILQELALEFSGSAKAAADADPLFRYNKLMGSIKIEVGEAAMSLLHELTPALESFANGLKSTIEFVKEHKDGLLALGKSILTAYAAFKIITGAQAIISALTIAWQAYVVGTAEATLATTAFGTALQFAMGPLGLITIAISGLALAYNMLTASQAENERQNKKGTTDSNEEFIKQKVDKYVQLEKQSGLSHAAYIKNEKERIDKSEKEINAYNSEALKTGGKTKDVQDVFLEREALSRFGGPKALGKAAGAGAGAKATGATPPKTDKATGSKSVTINMQINDIIKEFTINTTNIKEGANRVKDMVADALLNSINSSLHTAGQ